MVCKTILDINGFQTAKIGRFPVIGPKVILISLKLVDQ